MKLAIIDLGSNSVRFDVYEVGEGNDVRRIHREKQMVRLGDCVFVNGVLDEIATRRTLRAFEEFSLKSKIFSTDHISAYATAALRESKNPEKLVKAVQEKTGIQIEIISGEQESQLIAKGILENESVPEGSVALVDIGGGSTEITYCQNRKIIDSRSFPLGSNRLQQIYLQAIPPKPSKKFPNPVDSLRSEVRKVLESHIKTKKWPEISSIVGSSGTIKSFRKILKKNGKKVQPFRTKSLDKVIEDMTPLNENELTNFPGIEPKRVDLALAGGLLLSEIAATLGTNRIFTTEFALRDGLLGLELEKMKRSR